MNVSYRGNVDEKHYVIYRESVDEENIIGHLHLDTIKLIHGPDIYINHRKGFVIVKKEIMGMPE